MKKSSLPTGKMFDGIVLLSVLTILVLSSVTVSSGFFQQNENSVGLLSKDAEINSKEKHYTFSMLADDVCDDCDDDPGDSGKNEKPVAYIYEIVPNPGQEFQTVSFLGYGEDPDGEVVNYRWESNIDTFLNESVSFNTTMLSPGTHTIYFYVQDNDDTWSEPVNATLEIIENQPPAPPVIGGESKGKTGEEKAYNFITSDPNGNEIYYLVDWDDDSVAEWIGTYNSDEEVTLIHTWNNRGSYTIRAKAKDPYDAESDWATMEVSMPKSRSKGFTFLDAVLNRLFERYPLLEIFFE